MMKPNILFILVDSLRSDKCHGKNKKSITPNIDKLINEGIYFDQTICSAPATAVSVSSILSGLYPFNTGMGEKYQKFNSDIPTYVKLLKENGYHVYATTPEIAVDFGLTCDFDNPDDGYDNYFSLFSGLGKQIHDKIINHKLDEPWFFYIHLFDLHSPVVLPEQYSGDEFGESQYEKMISAIDHWIGKFLEEIDLDKTLVVLTADHGEYVPVLKLDDQIINLEPTMAEQNIWKIGNMLPSNLYPIKKKFGKILRNTREKMKSSKIDSLSLTPYQKRILTESRMGDGHRLFDDLIHVPLLFSGMSLPSKIIHQQIRHIDVFPTIFELLKLPPKNHVDGISFLPLIHDSSYKELPAYIESPPEINKTSKRARGVRTSQYKYLRNYDDLNTSVELYDLKADPLEESNIAKDEPNLIQKFEEILQNILKDKHYRESHNDSETEKIEDELKKLGYV